MKNLSISQKSVHSLKKTGLKDVALVHDEHNLLISATRATQNVTQVVIKIDSSVLAMNLKGKASKGKKREREKVRVMEF